MADEPASFADKERRLIEMIAEQRGVTFEEAVQELASEGLARRFRKSSGKRPSPTVLKFRRRR